MKRLFSTCLVASALAACAGQQNGFDQAFTKRWQSDSGDSANRLYERLKGTAAPSAVQVAVGVTRDGLVGKPLGAGAGWSYAGRIDTVPQVSGGVVAFTSGANIVALDAQSGALLWKVDAGKRQLRGVGDDGSTTAVSLGDAQGTLPSQFLLVTRSGSVAHRYEMRAPLGVPAVYGGIAFVPWDNQYVTAIDATTGEEVARILLRHQVSHAQTIGGELYFGQLGLTRFDEKIGAAQRQGANFVALPEKKVPGDPEWYKDGTQVYTPSNSATTKIHLWARPAPNTEGLGVAGNTYAAGYFSVAFGLDAKDGSLKWTRALGGDIVGGGAAADGFALCDATGKVWGVGSSGQAPLTLANLGKPLAACVVQADSLGVAGEPDASIAEQVQAVFDTHRPSLATAYSFLVEELPSIDDPLVTKILIDLIEHPRTVPSLAKRAEVLLAKQRTGVEYMLAALERHYDFLSGNRPPPVGPLAVALAAIGDRNAAPLLAKHLNDPATATRDVPLVASALAELATSRETDDLKTFFALYRATADEPPLVEAVVKIAHTLIRVGGPSGQEMVEFAATDPLTHPTVRSKITETIYRKAPKPAPKAQADGKAT
ncbi:MAG TPA: PQQ-binding-like beta-propeller repeat protein [Polyangiaceae bacterium]|nr:PQQ-binding-like beta-propeller repeat protein [Polyangiaceae bacterium]